MTKNKIVSYDKRYCRNRDCISLFFEYVGEGFFRINKFYYNSKTFISYLNNDFNDGPTNYLNIRSSNYLVDWTDMLNTLSYLSNVFSKNDYFDKSKSLELIKNKFEDSLNIENEYDGLEFIESIVDELNSVLLGYQYCFGTEQQKHYFNFDLIELLKNNIDKVPYTKDAEDVKIPACLPREYQTIDDPELYELRVYSVGQANCSALIRYFDKNKEDYLVVAVFDFGLENKRRNLKLEEMINKIDENTTIIISHFHNDHINNICKAAKIATCRWLFPEHQPNKFIGNLLYHDLIKTASRKSYSGTKVFSYKAPYDLSEYIRINQNTGSIGDSKHQHSTLNAQSIIVSLHIKNTNVLIPADALYKDFPEDVFRYEYDYVLIPHHGCKYCEKTLAKSSYYDSIKRIVLEKTKGVVMCGYDGRKYGHANTNHLNWYNYVCAFSGSSYYISRKTIDSSYAPTKVEASSFYRILFK